MRMSETEKSARAAYKREWYLRNRERILAERASERINEPVKVRERKRAHYSKNKERISSERKKRYAEEPNLRTNTQDRTRAWRAAHREQHRAYNREWAQRNPTVTKERMREWFRTNPVRVREQRILRRCALYRAGRPDRSHVRALEAARVCAYCGDLFDALSARKHRTVDHVLPLALGGTNVSGNLVAACKACNSSKNKRTLAEWVTTGLAPVGAKNFLALLDTCQGRG